MPYLGASPKETFTAGQSQTITGTGATSYSLNTAVTTPEDLEVFINNVRQQPTTAYTVSGSTITFDEALLSSDTCYVVFQGQRKESRTHPAASNLQAANATVTGDLTVDTNTLIVDSSTNKVGIGGTPDNNRDLHIKRTGANASIKLEETSATNYGQFIELKDSATSWFIANRYANSDSGVSGFGIGTTNSGDMLQVNTSGHVIMPSQPVVALQPDATSNETVVSSQSNYTHIVGWKTVGGRQTTLRAGINLSGTSHGYYLANGNNTGRITFSTGGLYYFDCTIRLENQPGAGNIYVIFNGNTIHRMHVETWGRFSYAHGRVSRVVSASAGDYMEFAVACPTGGTFSGSNDTVNWLTIMKVA